MSALFPFSALTAEHRELGLVVAVLLGFAFGFVLERAGFGRADKLAAQFYLHDMTVFKVMFTAIVTAMLGVILASGVGLVELKPLSEWAISETYLWPMIAGGFLLGVGFIVSGYCPGTSLVAMASGSIDGLFTVVGVVLGTVVFSEAMSLRAVAAFNDSGAMGSFFFYQWLKINPAILALGVTVMALAAFLGAEKIERIFQRKRSGGVEPAEAPRRPRRLAFSVLGVLGVLAIATLVLPVAPRAAARKEVRGISQAELGRRLLEQPWALRILDLRPRAACVAQRIPTAECTPADALDKLGLADSPSTRDLVLVSEGDLGAAPVQTLLYAGRVLKLDGGFAGWRRFALTKPALPAPSAPPSELEAYRFRAALHGAMTGMKVAPPPAPSGGGTAAPRKKKGGGCSG
jgi:hypothetical protein